MKVAPYVAVALQATCDSVAQDDSTQSARARIASTLARYAELIETTRAFLSTFHGVPVRLVVLPEYALTGYPFGLDPLQWRAKAALDPRGAEMAALSAIAARHQVYLAVNFYELDAHFPELFFQCTAIFSPVGERVLKYHRLISLFAPTPFDVWDQYLDAYGYESIFPVVTTDIGTLGAVASEEILFPEIARALALKGAELLVHPTSEVGSPALTPKQIARRARALENGVYVVSANTAGIQGARLPACSTDGMSEIIAPDGTMSAAALGGESMAANAIIDIDACRGRRERTGMTNLLSRLPLEAFAPVYAQSMAERGRLIDKPLGRGADALAAQQRAINRLRRPG